MRIPDDRLVKVLVTDNNIAEHSCYIGIRNSFLSIYLYSFILIVQTALSIYLLTSDLVFISIMVFTSALLVVYSIKTIYADIKFLRGATRLFNMNIQELHGGKNEALHPSGPNYT
jgi:hypothetical protein